MEKEISNLINPSKKEIKKVNSVTKEVFNKIEKKIKEEGITAQPFLGGSVAKETWLPGTSDIDLFLRFDYEKYKSKSNELSDLLEKILEDFNTKRRKGSRDYFIIEDYEGFEIEIVPVLNIDNPKQEKNITDVSPLHVKWVKDKINERKSLSREIKIAKLFLKAQRCYGAESYIKGFSGHVTDILIAYYNSFRKFIKAVPKWEPKMFIDIENHYKGKKEAMEKMNSSKLQSPLIVVDPIQPERNAAAALSREKFERLKKSAKEYLKKPGIEFFKEERITIEDLEKKDKLIVLEAEPQKEGKDRAGAELLKKFQKVKRRLKEHDFKILNSGWQWYPGEKAMYWLYFPKKPLSKKKRHDGPPFSADKKDIQKFKEKWSKVRKNKKRYLTIIERKYTKPEQLLKDLNSVKIIYTNEK